ncbi:MAG: hypothetical protein JWO68_1335 [Actinomycetia bacterium]|nr:hypothetical protein [Actinomycetes bacterium]
MIKRVALLLGVLCATILAGCGADDGAAVSASASASGAPSEDCKVVDGVNATRDAEVHVDLAEYSISLDTQSVAAGNIEFHTTNKGKEPHELVIIRGAKPMELTIGAKGLDEAKLPAGAEVLGEIEPFVGNGGVCSGVFTLAAGDYTLLCNVVETSGEKHAHAHEGMVTTFSVT